MDDLRIDLAKKYLANILQKEGDLNPSPPLPKTCFAANIHTLDNISNQKISSNSELQSNCIKQQLVQEIKKKLLNASLLETENLKLLEENKKLNLQFASSQTFLQEILNEIKETKKSISSQNLTISLIKIDLTKIKNKLLQIP